MLTNSWSIIIFCAVCIAMMLTAILVPKIRDLALLKNLFDKPDRRKVHNGIVPRLGGFSFFPVILITFCVVIGITLSIPESLIEADIIEPLPKIMVLFACLAALFIGGFFDDIIGVRYMTKFLIQALCSVFTVLSGVAVFNYYGILGFGEVPLIVSYFISFFLIIYIINSINLIDGIDGLASGITIITLVVYGYEFFINSHFAYSMLSITGAGIMIIFFIFNFFGKQEKKKKIFMGDIGSLTIGMFIAFMAFEVNGEKMCASCHVNPLLVAFSPLIIPLFDVVRVFLYRITHGKSPFLPDKSHIHHKLMLTGCSQHKALYLLLLAQIIFIAFNLSFSNLLDINIILGIDIAIYIICNLLINMRLKRLKTIKD